MTECQGHTGDYFDYKCYQRLKEYYEKPFVSDDIVDFLDKYIKSSGEKQNFISTYYNIFVKLTNHLAGDGLAYHNKGITCKYLNYWLNQEILVRPEINEFNFVGFQSYADEHAKYKSGERSYKAKSCRNYFNYLHNDNKYKKMEILYKMYHLYKEIKEWNEKHDKTKICNNFKLIEKFYYNIINEYQGDEDLNNKLKIFKYLVIKPITPYKVSCDFTISNLMPHEIVSSPKEEPSHKQEQTLESQLPSKTDLTKGLEEKSGDQKFYEKRHKNIYYNYIMKIQQNKNYQQYDYKKNNYLMNQRNKYLKMLNQYQFLVYLEGWVHYIYF
ncbi:hypothetical protein PVIIG_05504 [Plasmodium vivax India VII]|uniref:Uncharacterized protein n=1 Tax=Plasmodium vivax India VII TaxID=1077284 RepID=A0A0J9S3S0_PLAVI|nr:hypothetical protein PVIIG_05504 [Plasmodium vivax India VII]